MTRAFLRIAQRHILMLFQRLARDMCLSIHMHDLLDVAHGGNHLVHLLFHGPMIGWEGPVGGANSAITEQMVL